MSMLPPDDADLERVEDLTNALQSGVESTKRRLRGEHDRTPNDALRFYSALTHFIGLGLSIAGLVLLVVMAAKVGTVWHVVGFSIYGTCMTGLYAASAFYHSLRLPPKGRAILRRLDHTMIYVFIAGVYTPICLLPLRGAWGWSMFGVLWGLAIAGIIFKNVWMTAPRWLSAGSYVVMGWMAVVAFYPMTQTMPVGAIVWLLAGGVFYTTGAVLYALKWPGKHAPRFGFHEYFHVLVLLGSASHFIMMFQYLLYN